MSVIVLGYNSTDYGKDDFARFAECEIEAVWYYNYWWETEPFPGKYNFDRLLEAEDLARANGVKMYVHTPVGTPLWADPSWYLLNQYGQGNDFSKALASYNPALKDLNEQFFPWGNELGLRLVNRFFSYWHAQAESYTQNYIGVVKNTFKHAITVGSLGCWGEYFFPSPHFYQFMGIKDSPWWYDINATYNWVTSGLTREDWCRKELLRVLKERMLLGGENWVLLVPYWKDWDNFQFGNDGFQDIYKDKSLNLKSILLSVFPNYVNLVSPHAKLSPTYGGAGGAEGVAVNALAAQKLGLAGLFCGLLGGSSTGSGSGLIKKTEPWMFENVKKAVWIFKHLKILMY